MRRGLDAEVAGRDVGPGERQRSARPADGGEHAGGAGIEERVLGQRAGGDEADDLALHRALRAAFAGQLGVLHLLADGDPEALADQLLEIGLGGVDGDPAHRDVFAQVLAALGERDIEGRGGLGGVFEEQLVEIPHPVEQQVVPMGGLDLQILRHHGRGRVRGLKLGPPAGRLGLPAIVRNGNLSHDSKLADRPWGGAGASHGAPTFPQPAKKAAGNSRRTEVQSDPIRRETS